MKTLPGLLPLGFSGLNVGCIMSPPPPHTLIAAGPWGLSPFGPIGSLLGLNGGSTSFPGRSGLCHSWLPALASAARLSASVCLPWPGDPSRQDPERAACLWSRSFRGPELGRETKFLRCALSDRSLRERTQLQDTRPSTCGLAWSSSRSTCGLQDVCPLPPSLGPQG